MSETKKLFIYDWDDNIMFMPSILHLEKRIRTKWVPVDVTPGEYAKIKNNANIRDIGEESYFDFHDDKTFFEHLTEAIYWDKFGPSFKSFKKALINGEDFAILTARGHSPKTIMTGVFIIIARTFTDDEIHQMMENTGEILEYLMMQEYFTISSENFNQRFGTFNHQSTKYKKSKALYAHIIDRFKHYRDLEIENFQVIFSDDDVDNVEAAVELFYELKVIHPNVEFKIFDTSKKKKKEIVI